MKRSVRIALAATLLWASSVSAESAKTNLTVDTAASYIGWTGKKVLGAHDGTVKLKEGSIVLEGDKIVGGSFEIDMSTIDNKDLASSPKDKAKLEGHLKSADFFNIPEFPTGKFEITKTAPAADGKTQIDGSLTVKGITVPISFLATITSKDGTYVGESSTSIDRTKWDIRYNSKSFFDPAKLGDKMIYDDLEITLYVVAKEA